MRRQNTLIATLAAVALGTAACGGGGGGATDVAPDIALGFQSPPQVADLEPHTSEPATASTLPAPTTTTTTAAPAANVVPVAASDPVGLAEQITRAETAIRDPDTPPAQLSEAALLHQIAYRHLARNPDWDEAVLAAVPESFRLSVTSNAQARREFRGMHTKLATTMPPWRIVEPLPADELLAIYMEAEAEFGIRWQYLASINLVETGMGRIRGTSVANAQGPMQFIPSTWAAFGAGGDINDTHDAIFAAARYLNHNGGHEGQIDNALFRYNNHNNYVRAVKAYADVMFDDPRTYYGFHQWQVVYLTERGDIVLFPGYDEAERVPVDEWLAANPR